MTTKKLLVLLERIWKLRVEHLKLSEDEKDRRAERDGFFMDYSTVDIAVENPMGMMEKQLYMEKWTKTGCGGNVVMNAVDYCMSGHPYNKPSKVWTTARGWTPQQCKGRCKSGYRNPESGKWVHRFKLGQGSKQMVAGPGRVALAASVPKKLLLEVLDSSRG